MPLQNLINQALGTAAGLKALSEKGEKAKNEPKAPSESKEDLKPINTYVTAAEGLESPYTSDIYEGTAGDYVNTVQGTQSKPMFDVTKAALGVARAQSVKKAALAQKRRWATFRKKRK